MKSLSSPKKRSKYRLYFGAAYFRLKRSLMWRSGKFRFAKVSGDPLPYTVFRHATPLMRKLKDVDMYLQYNKITN
ncbi:MAG: vancomycin resistance protein, partial [Oscillospiraceae bacterium]|nr:vancomycin resistance protein [Oscillospiraceae bacterium]